MKTEYGMPTPWFAYALRINEDCLPPANIIDRSGKLPWAVVRPLVERMFLELCSNRILEVHYGPFELTLKKRGDKYAIFNKGKTVGAYRKFESTKVLEWLENARPKLRLIQGEKK